MLSSKQSKYGTFFMHRLSNLGMSFPKLAALPRPFSRQPTFAFRCRFCLRILTSFPSRQNQQFDKKNLSVKRVLRMKFLFKGKAFYVVMDVRSATDMKASHRRRCPLVRLPR